MEEDDTYPEQIIGINETLNQIESPGRRDWKDKFQRFMAKYEGQVNFKNLSKDNLESAVEVVKGFFKYLEIKRELHISEPSDYDNMIFCPPLGKNGKTYFAQVLYINSQPAAFFAVEPIASDAAGLFANITLYQEFPYLSEYLIVHVCKLLKAVGFKYLNLGGSETAGLFQFKEKFSPVEYNKMHWVVYKM